MRTISGQALFSIANFYSIVDGCDVTRFLFERSPCSRINAGDKGVSGRSWLGIFGKTLEFERSKRNVRKGMFDKRTTLSSSFAPVLEVIWKSIRAVENAKAYRSQSIRQLLRIVS